MSYYSTLIEFEATKHDLALAPPLATNHFFASSLFRIAFHRHKSFRTIYRRTCLEFTFECVSVFFPLSSLRFIIYAFRCGATKLSVGSIYIFVSFFFVFRVVVVVARRRRLSFSVKARET